jgi:hypothetical protein
MKRTAKYQKVKVGIIPLQPLAPKSPAPVSNLPQGL